MTKTELEDVKKVVKSSIKWLATDYKYFQELRDDISSLTNALSHSGKKRKFVSELKRALADFKSAGRSEKKFNRYAEKLKSLKLSEVYSLPPELLEGITEGSVSNIQAKLEKAQRALQEIQTRINIESSNVVKAASFYEGEIRKRLDALQATVEEHDSLLQEKKDWDLSPEVVIKLDSLEQEISKQAVDLKRFVEQTLGWIRALSIDLDDAKNKYAQAWVVQTITPKNVSRSIERISDPSAKIHHLGYYLKEKARKKLPNAVILEAKRLIGQIAKANNLYETTAEMYKKLGLWKEGKEYDQKASEYWEKKGDQLIKEKNVGTYPKDYDDESTRRIAITAAEAYEKAGKWKKAGAAWCRSYDPDKAVRAYLKVNSFGDAHRIVGVYFMRLGKEAKKLMVGWQFLRMAARVFQKGRLFEEAGDAWSEYAHNVKSSFEDINSGLLEAFNCYNSAGNQQKRERVRRELNKILAEQKERERRYAEEIRRRANIEMWQWKAITEAGGDWTGNPPSGYLR